MRISFNSIPTAIALICLFSTGNLFAQRYLSEKRPDLVLLGTSVKRVNTDQLNVIWSIKNVGEATATGIDNLVALNLESSNKPNRAGETHNWVSRGSGLALNTSKKELKPGEIVSGSSLVSCSAKDLVSLRVSLYIEQDNLAVDVNKENNSIIAILIGL